jgi:hypothetical protein
MSATIVPAAASAAVRRARIAAGWRRVAADERELEEARRHAGGHKTGPDSTYRPRCPHCHGIPAVGAVVRIVHASGCPRARVHAGRAAAAAVCQPEPARPPVRAAAEPAAVPGPAAAAVRDRRAGRARHGNRGNRGRQRRRGCAWTSASPAVGEHEEPGGPQRFRPWVIASWFVSGARVWAWVAEAGRWVAATARRIFLDENGFTRVRVDLDEWDCGWHGDPAGPGDPSACHISDLEPEWAAA